MWDSKCTFATCLYYCASLLLATDIEAYRIYSNIPTAVIYDMYKFRCKVLFVFICAWRTETVWGLRSHLKKIATVTFYFLSCYMMAIWWAKTCCCLYLSRIYICCVWWIVSCFILVFATVGSECSASHPGCFTSRKDFWYWLSMMFEQRELLNWCIVLMTNSQFLECVFLTNTTMHNVKCTLHRSDTVVIAVIW
jgi:hypothetical protein